jgi:hypothetical protein
LCVAYKSGFINGLLNNLQINKAESVDETKILKIKTVGKNALYRKVSAPTLS